MMNTANDNGSRTLENCSVSEKMHNGEKRLGRFTFHRIDADIYEVLARCRAPQGGFCFRSFGLFRLADIPQWVWEGR